MILLAKRISVKQVTPADDDFKFKRKSSYDVIAVDNESPSYLVADDDGRLYWLDDQDEFSINEVTF